MGGIQSGSRTSLKTQRIYNIGKREYACPIYTSMEELDEGDCSYIL